MFIASASFKYAMGHRKKIIFAKKPMTAQEYGVVKSMVLLHLITEVDRLITEGWQPVGGIATAYGKFSASGEPAEFGSPAVQYCQAIVR